MRALPFGMDALVIGDVVEFDLETIENQTCTGVTIALPPDVIPARATVRPGRRWAYPFALGFRGSGPPNTSHDNVEVNRGAIRSAHVMRTR